MERFSERQVPVTLVVLALGGVAARLVRLGDRVFYYDEAWFGYWVLRFMENGVWEYRPILHGPFFVRVNPAVFSVAGASDGSARLVVAVLGGLLPLAAWLFRDRLHDGELVALGVALALTPVLFYYSRFMRKDLPLAAFMFVTLGLLVRASDTGRPRFLYAAGATLGLAFSTKESALLWLVTWAGAGLVVLDRCLLRARGRDGGVRTALRMAGARARATGRFWWPRAALTAVIFLGVVVYFYAPRAGPGQPVGLWRALGGEFTTIPAVVEEATRGSFQRAVEYWVAGSIQNHPYLPYFADTAATVLAGALGVTLLAPVGFLFDRYSGDAPRGLVAFNFYCGVFALLGYPLANNFPVPWSTVHAVVPLCVPAAVGAFVVYRWGRSRLPAVEPESLRARVPMHGVRAVVATVVLVFLVASAGLTVAHTSYQHPHRSPELESGNEIVYYAQAPGDLREVTTAVGRATETGGEGPDVLYIGERLAMDESRVRYPPATGAWHARIPLPWYTEAAEADVASVNETGSVSGPTPPVVITTPQLSTEVASSLGDSYTNATYPLDNTGDRVVVVFVHTDVRPRQAPTSVRTPPAGTG